MDISDLIRPLTFRVGQAVPSPSRRCVAACFGLGFACPPTWYLYLKMLCKTSRRLSEESRVMRYGRLLFKWDAQLAELFKRHLQG